MSVSARAGERIDSPERGVLRAALLSAVLFATVVFAPRLGVPAFGLLSALAAHPLALARLSGTGMSGVWSALIAALLIASVAPMGFALAYLVLTAVPGLLMGESLTRGRGLLRGSLQSFAWLATCCGALLLVAGERLSTPLLAALDQLRAREFLEQMRTQGVPLEQIDAWSASAGAARELLAVIYPAFYVVLAGLTVALNAWLIRRHLIRHDAAWLERGEFENLRWPLAVVVVFVLSAFGLLLPAGRSAAANALVLVGFLFVLQGLAVAAFVGRRLLPPAVPWLITAVLILTHVLVPLAALALLGLFDQWLDARRWAEVKAAGED
jgi:hypothetical protein